MSSDYIQKKETSIWYKIKYTIVGYIKIGCILGKFRLIQLRSNLKVDILYAYMYEYKISQTYFTHKPNAPKRRANPAFRSEA